MDVTGFVGYRVSSIRVMRFKRGATWVLHTYTIQGCVMNRTRMDNRSFMNEEYLRNWKFPIGMEELNEREAEIWGIKNLRLQYIAPRQNI